jgi:pyruvate kinase
MKRTKIVCTIGPATAKEATLVRMINAGMNVARLNMSHGTHADHAQLYRAIRAAAQKTGQPVMILQDLQGPKIRVGNLPKEGIALKFGDVVIFTVADKGNGKIPVSYKQLNKDVKPGDRILLDDGLLEVEVKRVEGQDIKTKVLVGGTLLAHKGMNIPTTSLSVSALTVKDKEDLVFGVKLGVDAIALSFVRRAEDIRELRRLVAKAEKSRGKKNEAPTLIISKIEKHEALKNIDAILKETDAVMVARGDLAVETPAAEVPIWQKTIIQKCLIAAKPVIVATQMLESMTRNPRPTRAEISDVANAIIDHTDAIMLSAESATGKFPVEAVTTMSTVAVETEASIFDDIEAGRFAKTRYTTEEAVSEVSKILAADVAAKGILVASMSGGTGRLVSRHRPELAIYVATDSDRVRRQLNLSWGVVPFKLPRCKSVEELVEKSVGFLKQSKDVKKNDKLIIIAGEPVGISGGVNLVEIREIK